MNEDQLHEVKPLQEPVREPTHCGKRMRKLQNASPTTGKLITVYSCDGCGHQERVTS